MKKKFPYVIFILAFVFSSLWGGEFYAPGQVVPGNVLTSMVTGCAAEDEVRFILTDPEGKVRSLVEGIPFEGEDVPSGSRIGLIGIDSGLSAGTYTIRAEVKRDMGTQEFEAPLLIRSHTFRSEDISLNTDMSNLRSSEEPEKLEQSRRLWALLATVGEGNASFCDPMLSPVENYVMTSQFGDRRNFLYADGGTAGSIHTGSDMAAQTGTSIFAPLAGKVVMAEKRILTGNTVVLEHFPGIYTLYYHMDTINLKAGDSVVPGDPMGTVGATGLVTGPHLHWELRINTIPVDPMIYLETGLIDKDQIMAMINGTKEEGR